MARSIEAIPEQEVCFDPETQARFEQILAQSKARKINKPATVNELECPQTSHERGLLERLNENFQNSGSDPRVRLTPVSLSEI